MSYSQLVFQMSNYGKENKPTKHEIMERKWCWFGHTLSKPQGAAE